MARARTWTDEQLRKAVAGAATWADVARSLGLRAEGRNTFRFRGHAARLGLDVSHLPAARASVEPATSPAPFDSAAVITAVHASRTWAGVLRRLGLNVALHNYRRVQEIAAQTGVALRSGQESLSDPVDLPAPLRNGERSSLVKGACAEGAVTAALLRAGYNVLTLYMITRYDLVIEGADGFYRVQCKAAHLKGDALVFSTKSKGRCYEGEVDYLGVYEPTSGHVYMVPIEVVGSRQSVALRLDTRDGERCAKRFRL
jgi:hypothetical protein